MPRQIEILFRAPYALPNDLQRTEEGLWIVDQATDRVALVAPDAPDAEYRTCPILREIATESSNTSGLSFGEGSLWLAANGSGGGRWRTPRATDAREGEILRVDPETGRTLARFSVPGGGGTHGLDYDPYEPGTLWLTTLRAQTLTQIAVADGAIRRTLPLPYGSAHGVVCAADGVWVVHKLEWAIVKLDRESGAVRDRIDVPRDRPEVHGLAWDGDRLLYCDATTGWIVAIAL